MAKKVKPVLKSIQYRTLYKRGKKYPLIDDGREDCVCSIYWPDVSAGKQLSFIPARGADPHEFWCVGQVSIKINIDALKPARSTRHVTGKSHQFPALIR